MLFPATHAPSAADDHISQVAHSLEPLAQLEKLTSIRKMKQGTKGRLACSMVKEKLRYREVVKT